MNNLLSKKTILIAGGVLIMVILTVAVALSQQQKHTDITDGTSTETGKTPGATTGIKNPTDILKPSDLVTTPVNTTQDPDPANNETIGITNGDQLDNNLYPSQSALVVSFISQYIRRDLGKSVTSVDLLASTIELTDEKMKFTLEGGNPIHQIKVDITLIDTDDGVNITFTDPKGSLPKFTTGDVYYDLYFTPSDPSIIDAD